MRGKVGGEGGAGDSGECGEGVRVTVGRSQCLQFVADAIGRRDGVVTVV